MSNAIERLEGLRDGFIKGQEEANRVMEQILHTSYKPIVCPLPETEAVKILQEQILKMRCFVKTAKILIKIRMTEN